MGRLDGSGAEKLVWVPHFDQVTDSGAFDQTEKALRDKPAECLARGSAGDAGAAGKPGDGEADARLSFEERMPEDV